MTTIVDTASSRVPSFLTLFANGLAQKGLTIAFTTLAGYGFTLAPDQQTKLTTLALSTVGAGLSIGWTWLNAKIHDLRVKKALAASPTGANVVTLPLRAA